MQRLELLHQFHRFPGKNDQFQRHQRWQPLQGSCGVGQPQSEARILRQVCRVRRERLFALQRSPDALEKGKYFLRGSSQSGTKLLRFVQIQMMNQK